MFPQRKCMSGQRIHEKVLNITTHLGNANHVESHLTLVAMAIVK